VGKASRRGSARRDCRHTPALLRRSEAATPHASRTGRRAHIVWISLTASSSSSDLPARLPHHFRNVRQRRRVESSVSGVTATVAVAGGEQKRASPSDDDRERSGEGDAGCRALRPLLAMEWRRGAARIETGDPQLVDVPGRIVTTSCMEVGHPSGASGGTRRVRTRGEPAECQLAP
jgi:hypothetical protein